jgi:hypothetical protein
VNAAEHPQFMQLLAETMAAYGKPLPEATMLKVWLSNMAPYPFRIVAAAIDGYRADNGEFAPVPAGIAKRCLLLDGRPGVEEAWAIALNSQDEADTVVWTAECAEAFALARPVLAMGDEVGARMAFKEAYSRLVAVARADRRAVAWAASVGWDGQRRDAAVARAVVAGLLPAPAAVGLLSGAAAAEPQAERAREQLAKVKQMLAEGAAEREARREQAHEDRIAAEVAEHANRDAAVAAYAQQRGVPFARRVG